MPGFEAQRFYETEDLRSWQDGSRLLQFILQARLVSETISPGPADSTAIVEIEQ